MIELVRDLSERDWVLDLGAGPGSFPYVATRARVVGLDLSFPASGQTSAGRIIGPAQQLPLKSGAAAAIVCNHTLEHFDRIDRVLEEVNRIAADGCQLWVAIPNGYSLDDALYRLVFEGGGHVNRFRLEEFVDMVERGNRFRLRRYRRLYSSFLYLKPPDPEKLAHYPRRARLLLSHWPPRLLETFLRWLNYGARKLDQWLGLSVSQYGWGFVFTAADGPMVPGGLTRAALEDSDLNVCFSCGDGHVEATLFARLRRFLFWNLYECPTCGMTNVYVAEQRRK